MPFYSLTLFITSFINLFLAVFVFTQDVKAEINRAFAFFGTCIAVWGFGMLVMTLAPNEEMAMTGIAILQLGLFFAFSSFLNFVLALIGKQDKTNKILCLIAYNLSLLFVILDRLCLITSGTTIVFGTYQPVAGPASPFFHITFLFFMSYGVYLLYRRFKITPSPLERDRIKYLFIGMFLVVASSITNILLVLGVRVYPTAHFALTIYALMVAYAIVRYRLMDITVIIKKTVVYSALTALVTGLWLGSVLIFERLFKQLLDYQTLSPALFTGITIAFIFQPFRLRVQNFVDKAFFRQSYDWALVIEKFGELVESTVDKKFLLESTLKAITQIIPVERASIMTPDEKGVYVINSSIGLEAEAKKARFDSDEPFIGWLKQEKRDLLRREVQENPNLHWFKEELMEAMERVRAHLIIPLFSRGKLLGLLNLGQKKSELDYSEAEINVLSSLSNQAALTMENIKLFEDKVANLLNTIHALGVAIEAKDNYAQGHCRRVEKYAVEIGQKLGLKKNDIDALRIGSILHDVGKIGVSQRILEKRGRLTEEEFEAIKQHSLLGAKITSPIQLPQEAVDVILSHHERLDGSGYPHGIKGEEISLPVRILGVVDAFEAMTSDRPYRKALSVQEATTQLNNGLGKLFDPEVVKTLLAILEEELNHVQQATR